ncbi:5-oxoprolinase subunit B family protein [Jatrophihabitans sp. YIM 134969]
MAVVGVRSYGAEALLVDVDSAAAVTALRARLTDEAGVVETMPGLQTVLVRFDPARVDPTVLGHRLVALAASADELPPPTAAEPRLVRVAYDGPDLDDVCGFTGLSADDVVAAHTAPTYRVALIGMAPGFYFLAGGDDRLQVPRRPSPRTKVPRGAVGLAGAFTGVYPKLGPGGWQLIGRALDDLWRADRYPAAVLAPGDTVRFEAA